MIRRIPQMFTVALIVLLVASCADSTTNRNPAPNPGPTANDPKGASNGPSPAPDDTAVVHSR